MPHAEYDANFETNDPTSSKLKSAFVQVSDIRKFEIGLYWTRATYFWTLIAVAFAGYFAIFSADKFSQQYLLSMIVGSVGFVFTFAWYLANRGSKYWQENWENHLDLLEDEVTGPLYKTVLERPKSTSLSEILVTGPLSVSVSKINQWVSLYVMSIWIMLMALAGAKSLPEFGHKLWDEITHPNLWLTVGIHALIILGAFVCCIMMLRRGKTHRGSHNPLYSKRSTQISGQTPP